VCVCVCVCVCVFYSAMQESVCVFLVAMFSVNRDDGNIVFLFATRDNNVFLVSERDTRVFVSRDEGKDSFF